MNSRSISPTGSKFNRRKTQRASKMNKDMIKLAASIEELTDEQFDEAQQRHNLKYYRSRVKGKTLKNKMKHRDQEEHDTLPSKPYEHEHSDTSLQIESVYPESLVSSSSSSESIPSEELNIISISNDSPKWKLEDDTVYSPKVKFGGGAKANKRHAKKRNTKKRHANKRKSRHSKRRN